MAEILGLMDKFSIVKQMSIFSNLNFFEKSLIAKSSTLVSFGATEKIYREGDGPDAFYCIVSGRVRLFVKTQSGKEETVEYLGRGSYFGIISLLTGEPHSVSIEVINDAIILKIKKVDFDYILERIPRLAVDLSQTLSRRLKRKDLHHKIIFESTIISVYSLAEDMERAFYSVNLSCSLKKETAKQVILLTVTSQDDNLAEKLEFLRPKPSLDLKQVSSHIPGIRGIVSGHASGIDILKIHHKKNSPEDENQIIPLLSYLADNYHYIVVDLPFNKDETILKALKQSDLIHIISKPQDRNLIDSYKFIKELESATKKSKDKLNLIVINSVDKAKFRSREELEDYVLANLPTFPLKEYANGMIMQYQDLEYARAIRRVAREIGKVNIGLALGCGAVSGLVHIGVIKVLEEENIPIDIVTGSSMGALIGAFWAIGLKAKEMEAIFLKEKDEITGNKILDFTFPKLGLVSGKRMEKFLNKYLQDKTFQDVGFTFKVMATNLKTKEEVILDRGSIAKAVRASFAIPGILEPVKFGKEYFLDGGVLNPVPVGLLVKKGIRKIIAVNVLPVPEETGGGLSFLTEEKEKKKRNLLGRLKSKLDNKIKKIFSPNIFDVIVSSLQAMEYVLAETACQQADVVIHPEIESMGWFDFFSTKELIELGEKETRKFLPEIKKLIGQ